MMLSINSNIKHVYLLLFLCCQKMPKFHKCLEALSIVSPEQSAKMMIVSRNAILIRFLLTESIKQAMTTFLLSYECFKLYSI